MDEEARGARSTMAAIRSATSPLLKGIWPNTTSGISKVFYYTIEGLPGPIRQEVEMRARDSESATIYTDVSGPRERRRERKPGTRITVDALEQ